MVIKYKRKTIIPILLVAIAFSETLKNLTTWLFPFIILSIFVLITFFCFFRKNYINTSNLRYKYAMISFKYMALPYVLIIFYSLIIIVIENRTALFLNRMIGNGISKIFIAIIVSSMVFLYQREAVNIICNGIILEYILSAIYAITKIGIKGLFEHIISPLNTYESFFEQHAVGFSLFVFLLYFLLYDRKKYSKKILLLIIIEYFIMKRVAIIGAVVALIIYQIYKKRKHKSFITYCIGIFIVAFVYMCFSTKPEFKEVMNNLNILNRALFVDSLSQYYHFGIDFVGRGYGFVSVVLPSIKVAGFLQTSALHNDVLKDYIELGFIGFNIAYMYLFIFMPIILYKKNSGKAQAIVLTILIYLLFTLFTDNFFEYSSTMGALIIVLVTVKMIDDNKSMSFQSEKRRKIIA